MKTCTKCQQEKDLSKFARRKGYRDGIESQCKACKQLACSINRQIRKRKLCRKCGEVKNASAFSKSKNSAVWCKECCRLNAAKWRAGNLEKARSADRSRNCTPQRVDWFREYGRKYRLFTKYGVTVEMYDILFEKQGGVCAICKEPPSEENTRWGTLHVDHCHTTGAVRGLLCIPCNTALGCVRDDIRRLQSAIKYLESV